MDARIAHNLTALKYAASTHCNHGITLPTRSKVCWLNVKTSGETTNTLHEQRLYLCNYASSRCRRWPWRSQHVPQGLPRAARRSRRVAGAQGASPKFYCRIFLGLFAVHLASYYIPGIAFHTPWELQIFVHCVGSVRTNPSPCRSLALLR